MKAEENRQEEGEPDVSVKTEERKKENEDKEEEGETGYLNWREG